LKNEDSETHKAKAVVEIRNTYIQVEEIILYYQTYNLNKLHNIEYSMSYCIITVQRNLYIMKIYRIYIYIYIYVLMDTHIWKQLKYTNKSPQSKVPYLGAHSIWP
jgi:hypothetical protein